MAEATQFIFERKEVLELLLKKQGIRTGRWTLMFEFGFSAGNVGPTPEAALPSAIVSIGRMGVQVADPADPHAIDAATIE